MEECVYMNWFISFRPWNWCVLNLQRWVPSHCFTHMHACMESKSGVVRQIASVQICCSRLILWRNIILPNWTEITVSEQAIVGQSGCWAAMLLDPDWFAQWTDELWSARCKILLRFIAPRAKLLLATHLCASDNKKLSLLQHEFQVFRYQYLPWIVLPQRCFCSYLRKYSAQWMGIERILDIAQGRWHWIQIRIRLTSVC